tara:strand:+ start:295 stop:624 length:330 start_codon:yes stop_codon:yes gene_type:complete
MAKNEWNKYLLPGGLLVVIGGNFVGLGADMVNLVALITGLAIGVSNITRAERTNFMIGTMLLALVGFSAIASVPAIGGMLEQVIGAVATLAGTAGIVVASKVLWETAQS